MLTCRLSLHHVFVTQRMQTHGHSCKNDRILQNSHITTQACCCITGTVNIALRSSCALANTIARARNTLQCHVSSGPYKPRMTVFIKCCRLYKWYSNSSFMHSVEYESICVLYIGTCEASRFDSISNRTSDSGFDS